MLAANYFCRRRDSPHSVKSGMLLEGRAILFFLRVFLCRFPFLKELFYFQFIELLSRFAHFDFLSNGFFYVAPLTLRR
jgi:hypothetical protein